MTASEKARATRARHKEAHKLREAERRETIARIKAGLLSVLDNEKATPAEKLEASRLLRAYV